MDDLVKYRLAAAAEKLVSAKLLFDNGQYKDSIGRSYYVIFTCMRAVLALDEVDYKKHSAVISYFQREYIKTQIFDVKYSKYIQEAFQIRNTCDYDDFYIASKSEAEEQCSRAEELLNVTKEYVMKRSEIGN